MKWTFAALISVLALAASTLVAAAPAGANGDGPTINKFFAGNEMFYIDVEGGSQFCMEILDPNDDDAFVGRFGEVTTEGSRLRGVIETPDIPLDTEYVLSVAAQDCVTFLDTPGPTSRTANFEFTSVADATVSTFQDVSVNTFDRGFQFFATPSEGSRIANWFFIDGPWAASIRDFTPQGTISQLMPLFFDSENLTNGSTYTLRSVTVGDDGFSAINTTTFVPQPTPHRATISFVAPWWLGAVIDWSTPVGFDGSAMDIQGYRIQGTTDDGETWTTLVADTESTETERTVTGLDPEEDYRFRVAAIVDDKLGAWSFTTQSITPSKFTGVVTWFVTNTSVVGNSGTIIPNADALSGSDGTIEYSIASAGTTGCTVNGATGVITYQAPGTCVVTASVPETDTYEAGSTNATFTITAPSGGGGGSSGGGSAPAPAPAPAPDPAPAPQPESAPAPAPAPVVPVEIPDPAAVTVEQFEAITPGQMALITPEVFQDLPTEAVSTLTPEQSAALTPAQVNTIRPARARELQPETVAALGPAQVTALRPAAVRNLQPAAIAAMSEEQLEALRPASVRRLTTPQLKALSPNQVTALDRQQLRSMRPVQFRRLRPATVAALDPGQIRSLTRADVRRLRNAQIEALTAEQLSSMRLAQLRAMRNRQVQSLSNDQVADLSEAQRDALGV